MLCRKGVLRPNVAHRAFQRVADSAKHVLLFVRFRINSILL